MAERLPQYIDGAFVQSTTTEWLPVRNPATQEILCEVPVATDEEMAQAVASAKAAFASWKEVAVPERSRSIFCTASAVMFPNKPLII